MNPAEMQILLPVLIAIIFIGLNARRMMRPRRFRPMTLWIGPVLVLVGVLALMGTQPAPSANHIAGLTAALALGGVVGWARGKLVRVDFDAETGMVTQRGTPFGVLFLIGLIVLRSGVRFVAMRHLELGIDLGKATDILLFFALGLVGSYAGVLYSAVSRVRRAG
jgi:hypothetical protein